MASHRQSPLALATPRSSPYGHEPMHPSTLLTCALLALPASDRFPDEKTTDQSCTAGNAWACRVGGAQQSNPSAAAKLYARACELNQPHGCYLSAEAASQGTAARDYEKACTLGLGKACRRLGMA